MVINTMFFLSIENLMVTWFIFRMITSYLTYFIFKRFYLNIFILLNILIIHFLHNIFFLRFLENNLNIVFECISL